MSGMDQSDAEDAILMLEAVPGAHLPTLSLPPLDEGCSVGTPSACIRSLANQASTSK